MATSRTWLLRNRILPKSGEKETGSWLHGWLKRQRDKKPKPHPLLHTDSSVHYPGRPAGVSREKCPTKPQSHTQGPQLSPPRPIPWPLSVLRLFSNNKQDSDTHGSHTWPLPHPSAEGTLVVDRGGAWPDINGCKHCCFPPSCCISIICGRLFCGVDLDLIVWTVVLMFGRSGRFKLVVLKLFSKEWRNFTKNTVMQLSALWPDGGHVLSVSVQVHSGNFLS